MSELPEAIASIFEQVKNAGADADIIIDESDSFSLKANQGELEEYKVSSTQIMGLRVIKDQHVGTAYSEATDEQSLAAMVDQALTNAAFTSQDEYEQLIDHAPVLHTDDALLYPDDNTSDDIKIETVLAMESALLEKPDIKNVPYNGLSNASHRRSIYSTFGLQATSRQRYTTAYAYALAERGDKNAMEGVGQIARVHQDINIDEIVAETYDNCVAMLEGTPVPSKHYDVIFDKECLSDLWGVFSMILSGKSAKDGINPWREKVGAQVADTQLSLWDKPRLVDGFGYELFDAEGTPTQNIAIINGGKLETLLHNSATARYFDTQSTGHAVRGPKSSLAISDHQLVIDAGQEPEANVKAGTTIEITDMTGLHSGADAISGDFSFGASGYLCQEGVRQQSIRGITVAGNFYKMLNKIDAIGDTQHWNWQKSSYMPLIRFGDIAISGE